MSDTLRIQSIGKTSIKKKKNVKFNLQNVLPCRERGLVDEERHPLLTFVLDGEELSA
jgi:hypothetical protein